MSILYTNIPPLRTQNGKDNFRDKFSDYIKQADSVEIATGYVSQDALEMLDKCVADYDINHIRLIVGMYYIEGMPENIYNTLVRMNKKWRDRSVGEIDIV